VRDGHCSAVAGLPSSAVATTHTIAKNLIASSLIRFSPVRWLGVPLPLLLEADDCRR
jgi:hypothetical protein